MSKFRRLLQTLLRFMKTQKIILSKYINNKFLIQVVKPITQNITLSEAKTILDTFQTLINKNTSINITE